MTEVVAEVHAEVFVFLISFFHRVGNFLDCFEVENFESFVLFGPGIFFFDLSEVEFFDLVRKYSCPAVEVELLKYGNTGNVGGD